ncbi:methyltransferase [Pseudidiomarina sp.]|uniref:methyltransferase n=1 Tax=Pseudidiomarina sp. TaxID=2081707 RepID=UPI00299D859E|nr:methyltransferase [Pseudidiomarina sp.]MDX1705123.1 methyltransferase [Pseudidiomarina sp.]
MVTQQRPAISPDQRLNTAAGSFYLQRLPVNSPRNLQAWDAADELIHDYLVAHPTISKPLLFNDQFGALLMPLAHLSVASVSDSYISHRAWEHNLNLNRLPYQLQSLSPLDPLPVDVDRVLMKVPKSLSLLEFQLARLAAELPPGTPLVAAAKSKIFTPAVRDLFQRYCDQVEVSLAQKKSRLLQARFKAVAIDDSQFINRWSVPELNLELLHHAGVFARNQLDIGARFLLENLPAAGAETVVDLGCGNGVLGISYARTSPASRISWIDESFLAVASTRANVAANLDPAGDRYQALVDDCLSQQPAQSCDLILCNPPFHQEHAVTSHIAIQMFSDARRVLRQGGELRVVANRHLAYHQPLKGLFGTVRQIAANPKFVILSVKKR